MKWQHLFLSFSGRTSRRDFWIGILGLVGAGIVTGLLPVVGQVLGLALLYPSTALMVKRLHDFGRSGWLAAIPLVPVVLAGAIALLAATAMSKPATMGTAFAAAGLAALVSTVAMLVGLAFLLWIGTRDGDAGTNAFGEPTGGAILVN
jgi:uncharacterized membrane protein YhaH (DUF805 family)